MTPLETMFRILLRSFPATYRAEHGEELAQFCRERWADEIEERGRLRATMRWPGIAWDLVKEGIGERVSSGHREKGSELRGRGPFRLTHDLRLAVRSLRRSPGFTAVAIATLAIAIASNSAMFRLVDAVLLRPLPYPAADRLITIDHPVPNFGENQAWGLSIRGYFHMRDETQAFSNMGAYGPMMASLSGNGPPERIVIARVTHSMMPVFGARPALGRLIDADDDIPGGSDAVVLGHGLWMRRYGADHEVLGQTIQLDGHSRTVIGVMEAGVHLPDLETDAWIPWGHDPASRPINSHYLNTVARLDDGVSFEQARADVERVFGTYGETFPQVYNDQFIEASGFGVRVRTLQERVVGNTANTLWVLLGSVGLVLFMAGANVANLFLIRTRMALLKYFLVESAVVAGASAALGLFLGGAGLRAITGAFPQSLPRLDELSTMVDGRTALFTLTITLGLTLILGWYGSVAIRWHAHWPRWGAATPMTAAPPWVVASWSEPRWPLPWCCWRGPWRRGIRSRHFIAWTWVSIPKVW